MNFFSASFVLFIATTSQWLQVEANSEVNVTVFYESLCPDSIRFVKKQLYPTYQLLKDYMYVEFVPFGKAHYTVNPWRITCQHGRFECYGNIVHACVLAKTPENDKQVRYINCMMMDATPPKAAKKCARKLKYKFSGIEECSNGDEGRNLIAQHGSRTRNFRERLSFVPTVLFNNKYSERDQREALGNLKSVVCKKLVPVPDKCNEPIKPQADEADYFEGFEDYNE